MKTSDARSELDDKNHGKGILKLAFVIQIDFASRSPPRHLEASRLRGLGASRLPDLRITGKKVKLELKDFLDFGITFGV